MRAADGREGEEGRCLLQVHLGGARLGDAEHVRRDPLGRGLEATSHERVVLCTQSAPLHPYKTNRRRKKTPANQNSGRTVRTYLCGRRSGNEDEDEDEDKDEDEGEGERARG